MTILYHADDMHSMNRKVAETFGLKKVSYPNLHTVCMKHLNDHHSRNMDKLEQQIKKKTECVIDHMNHPCAVGTIWQDDKKQCVPNCEVFSEGVWNHETKKCEMNHNFLSDLGIPG
tara:strand:+ start:142 stop:489 length:348 start_codon:yes stop_codon:yes gene_type:complete